MCIVPCVHFNKCAAFYSLARQLFSYFIPFYFLFFLHISPSFVFSLSLSLYVFVCIFFSHFSFSVCLLFVTYDVRATWIIFPTLPNDIEESTWENIHFAIISNAISLNENASTAAPHRTESCRCTKNEQTPKLVRVNDVFISFEYNSWAQNPQIFVYDCNAH